MFIRFDVIHERDGRTDRQTDRHTVHDSKDRACITSRGKMWAAVRENGDFLHLRFE